MKVLNTAYKYETVSMRYAVYEIFRVIPINNPTDMQGLTIFIIFTIVYNIVVEKKDNCSR